MRGHLWLGLLSLPLILFHGGFHFGGTLTRVLMWLLIITVGSGLFGALLQNYVPRIMTSEVPLETIYAEIENVRTLLREEGDQSVAALCGDLGFAKSEKRPARGGIHGAAADCCDGCTPADFRGGECRGERRGCAGGGNDLLTEEESAPLRRFYLQELRVFLEQPKRRGAAARG